MFKNRILILLFMLSLKLTYGQIGGQHVFQFLDLDFNARSAALGGDFITVKDDDINLAVMNPATISKKMDKNVALNHSFYPSGVNYGQIVVGQNIKSIGQVTGHLRYVSYGRFTRTDNTGKNIGKFTAGDYALGVGYGKELNERFSVGGNANLLFSHYESYSSVGVSIDFAAMYHNRDNNISATILARNVGVQLKSYTKKNKEPLPLEILAGVSYRLPHAPFRFSIMGHDLTDWDLSYNIPNAQPTIDQINQDTIPVPKASFVEKTFRHLIISAEVLPTEHFSIRLGYNYDRRKTFGIENRIGIQGFSAGVGFRVKKFDFSYSIAFYSAAGASNLISVTSNFSEWNRKSN